jgi:hypothetical protein
MAEDLEFEPAIPGELGLQPVRCVTADQDVIRYAGRASGIDGSGWHGATW